jgi:hypothetical protein
VQERVLRQIRTLRAMLRELETGLRRLLHWHAGETLDTANGPPTDYRASSRPYQSSACDVIIASAHADITCPSPPPPCLGSDFVTGGGWITAPSGAKASFAVAGGIKNGGFWGHLDIPGMYASIHVMSEVSHKRPGRRRRAVLF